MSEKKTLAVLTVVALMVISATIAPTPVRGDETDNSLIKVAMENPKHNSTITNQTPLIEISYSAPSGIDKKSVVLLLDGMNITYWESIPVGEEGLTYQVLTKLADQKQHNVTVMLSDMDGHHVEREFFFTVNTTYKESLNLPSIQETAAWILIAFGIGGAGFGIVVLYLRKTRGFTFRKHFAKHPIPKSIPVLVIPGVSATVFTLLIFAFVLSDPNITSFAYEYTIVAAAFIGLLPYAIYAQIEKKTIARYERAFSQFLFELADAMRGGIDPSKAVIELSKTDTSIMGDHLKIAARGIEMGRPFEEMITVMVKPIKSKLIKRYASLVGESAKVGGEISLVVHRAAKDMDDLIKIGNERAQSLMSQATTIYIAFGVLLIIIYQLIGLYPALGDLDIGGSMMGGSSSSPPRMSFETMKHRFYDLTIILSLGNGVLIGLFTSGKMKYGLLHGLVMVLITTLFFMLMII